MLDVVLDNGWHKQVHSKVSICAWCLLRNSLPTKDNLAKRGIISKEAHYCVSGCGKVESAQHLFFQCELFSSLWQLMLFWTCIHSVES
jgi:hypothetical protein